MSPQLSSTLEIKLDYYPKPKQTSFHTSEAKYRLYIGAWRAGKSFAGCQEALKKSFLYPKNVGLIGRKDYVDLLDTTYKTFLDICPKGFIRKEVKSPTHYMEFMNGSVIHFKSLKDETGLGSLDLGWFYVDEAEEVEENVFNRLKGRLSHKDVGKPSGWVTSNPPNESHWIHQQFEETNDKEYYTVYASTYENEENLPEGYIEDLEKMPLSWRKKYLEGQYGFTPDGKPFYEGFQEYLHQRKLEYIQGKTIFRGIDFGFHHPAIVWGQWDVKDRFMVLAELLGTDITIDKFAKQIIAFENEHFPSAKFKTYYDPAGEAVTDKSEKTSVEILAENGIKGGCRQSTYRERKELIERQLSTLIEGIPALVINKNCKITIDGFLGGYHYPKGIGGKPVLKEEPEKDGYYDHTMNALEYILINLLKVRKPGRKIKVYPTKQQRNAGISW